MKSIKVEYVRSNQVNDIFKVVIFGVEDFINFPSSMGMSEEDVKEHFIKEVKAKELKKKIAILLLGIEGLSINKIAELCNTSVIQVERVEKEIISFLNK